MDRNLDTVQIIVVIMVALRKESVDRNKNTKPTEQTQGVALRKESVDRNLLGRFLVFVWFVSLSARRAWIEIIGLTYDGLIASGRSPQGERG